MGRSVDSINVCRLGEADVALHREIQLLYSAAFEDPENYESNSPDDAYLAALLARADFIELAASIEGRLAGALSAYALPKFEQARAEVYIYDIAVSAAHRRKGVATAMIEALRPIARVAGAHVIFVQRTRATSPRLRFTRASAPARKCCTSISCPERAPSHGKFVRTNRLAPVVRLA